MHPLVRTQKQLDRVLEELDDAPGIVLYTLLERELANRLEEKCRTLGLPCLSIMGPVLQLFHSYLGGETKPRVGAQHALDADYFKRIDALNFTMMHDDGQHTDDLELADVVLVSGPMTGEEVELGNLKEAKKAVPGTPVFANTGVNIDNVGNILAEGDGAIVGTHFKIGGDTWKNVDGDRVRRFMDKVRKVR